MFALSTSFLKALFLWCCEYPSLAATLPTSRKFEFQKYPMGKNIFTFVPEVSVVEAWVEAPRI
jgi:hypothetical protein